MWLVFFNKGGIRFTKSFEISDGDTSYLSEKCWWLHYRWETDAGYVLQTSAPCLLQAVKMLWCQRHFCERCSQVIGLDTRKCKPRAIQRYKHPSSEPTLYFPKKQWTKKSSSGSKRHFIHPIPFINWMCLWGIS